MASGLKVTAPASISNINCGFDVLGAALEIVADELIGRRTSGPGVTISDISGAGKQLISRNPEENTAGTAILKFLEYAQIRNEGLEIEIHKRMKPGSGLGSSAASACAAVVLANALFGHPLSQKELLPLAIIGESIASRAFHADNVAPSLFGGITLVRDVRRLDVQRLNTPAGLYITLVIPEIRILTAESRSLLRPTVALRQMVRQSANLGAFVLALERSDFTLLREAAQDVVIEQQRAHLIPGFYDVRAAAYRAGVVACGISGSGPALFAISENSLIAERAGNAMHEVFSNYGVAAGLIVTRVSQEGTSLH
jgi:homoserine kinase